MTDAAAHLLSLDYPAEFTPGRAVGGDHLPAHRSGGEGYADYRPRHRADRRRAWARNWRERGCPWNVFVLEDLAPRPLVDMPAAVLGDMETSQVSIFAVQVQTNELRSRMQMTDVVNRRRMRHAHMVNITPEIMCQGMRADFDLVDRLSAESAGTGAARPRAFAPPPRRAPILPPR